jgi:hypothetical protein
MSIIERRGTLAIGLYCAMTIVILSAGMQFASAQALIGAAAPAFTLTDSNGRTLSLADFKGKTVVLEWTSHECPYVGKHYRGNNMQALQKKWTGQGVVWLSVISSAPGQPGYVSPQQANKLTADRDAAPTAVLFDPTGKVGHAYGERAFVAGPFEHHGLALEVGKGEVAAVRVGQREGGRCSADERLCGCELDART